MLKADLRLQWIHYAVRARSTGMLKPQADASLQLTILDDPHNAFVTTT